MTDRRAEIEEAQAALRASIHDKLPKCTKPGCEVAQEDALKWSIFGWRCVEHYPTVRVAR